MRKYTRRGAIALHACTFRVPESLGTRLHIGGVAILAVSYLQTAVNRRVIAGQKKDVWSLQLYQASLTPQDLPCPGAGRGHAHLRARGERLYVCARVCSVPANIAVYRTVNCRWYKGLTIYFRN